MVKNGSLLFYISNDSIILTECLYKLNSFFTQICYICGMSSICVVNTSN